MLVLRKRWERGNVWRNVQSLKRNKRHNIAEQKAGRGELEEVNEQVGNRGLGINNLSDFFANKIAPLLKSVHLRISGAELRGHASGSSLDFGSW